MSSESLENNIGSEVTKTNEPSHIEEDHEIANAPMNKNVITPNKNNNDESSNETPISQPGAENHIETEPLPIADAPNHETLQNQSDENHKIIDQQQQPSNKPIFPPLSSFHPEPFKNSPLPPRSLFENFTAAVPLPNDQSVVPPEFDLTSVQVHDQSQMTNKQNENNEVLEENEGFTIEVVIHNIYIDIYEQLH